MDNNCQGSTLFLHKNYTYMRVLTKSRFKLGLECPNKLYYTHKEEVYANNKSSNPFLEALASGGFQVEELARLHYPNGVLIEDDTDRTKYNYEEKGKMDDLINNGNQIITELESINSSIATSNLIQALNLYQNYKINKNTKSLKN